MRYELTAASERALAVAAAWTSCGDPDELHAPEVLLGLLAEPECRAALLLADQGIDDDAVRTRFATLERRAAPRTQASLIASREWNAALAALSELLIDYPRPLFLATEHLLLGLVAGEGEVAQWLSERGLSSRQLEAEVHRLAGHEPGPLPIDEAAATSTASDGGDRAEPSEVRASDQIAALRMLDAAANRAGEGLRVVEDYLRFALDDRHLTSVCKEIRHGLTAALAIVSHHDRHAARDTLADVGTEITTDAERTRQDSSALLHANFKRVEQALRSLEESAKLVEPAAAAALEQLRYRVYTLERSADITQDSLERLARARLYVLVDAQPSAEAFRGAITQLVNAGVHVIQLRDKQLADRELLARARDLRALTAGTDTLFVMNDRPDLAVLAEADGVHVGQEELSLRDVRRIVGTRMLVGVSTHSLEQARRAVLEGASYIGVGPTFASGTKQFAEFPGVGLLRAVHTEIRLPAFAIGGITLENLPEVLASGIERVAVSGAIVAQEDPAAAARRFLAALGESANR